MFSFSLRGSFGKRAGAAALALALALSMCVPVASFADQQVQEGDAEYLVDGGFEKGVYGSDSAWTVTASSWDGLTLDAKTTSDGAQVKEGEKALHWYASAENLAGVSQSVSLPAGTYTLGGFFSGDKTTPTLSATYGDSLSSRDVSLTGWGTWDEAKVKFTLNEASDVSIAVTLGIEADGWGDVDALYLTASSDGDEDTVAVDKRTVTIEPVKGLSEDFMRGVDISSVISLENAGVKFYNRKGKEEDIFSILADAGVNYVRARVWVNPNDEYGRSYGGGCNDLATTIAIGKRATAAGMKLLVDFHFSDFWAIPTRQKLPKAWRGHSLEQLKKDVSTYTTWGLNKLEDAGVDVGMVAIGNETGCNFLESKGDWKRATTLFNAGCSAVRAVSKDIKVMIHFAGATKDLLRDVKQLDKYKVDYDVLGVSWYAFYKNHGTEADLKCNLSIVAATYNKDVAVVEASTGYSYEDSDGQSNQVGDDTYIKNISRMGKWTMSPQGQAECVRDVIADVASVPGGHGVGYFYWEPTWITVGDTTGLEGDAWEARYAENQRLWEEYGCGWATKYCNDYIPTKWAGGSGWDNQAMFSPNGAALDSLNVFKYIYSGSTGNDNAVVDYDKYKVTIDADGGTVWDEDSVWHAIWKDAVDCTFADGTQKWVNVRRWVNCDVDKVVAAIQRGEGGVFTVHGILTDDQNTMVEMQVTVKKTGIKACKLSKSSFTYSGRACAPGATVTGLMGEKLTVGTDYKLVYSKGCKNVGTYTVTAQGLGKYAGTSKQATFTVSPKKTAVKKLVSTAKHKVTATWGKRAAQVKGYQLRYSLKKSMAAAKVRTVKKAAKTTCQLKQLKSGKKYYVQVRTYQKVGGKTYRSGWSVAKTVKVK